MSYELWAEPLTKSIERSPRSACAPPLPGNRLGDGGTGHFDQTLLKDVGGSFRARDPDADFSLPWAGRKRPAYASQKIPRPLEFEIWKRLISCRPDSPASLNDPEGGPRPTLPIGSRCGSEVGWALAHLQHRSWWIMRFRFQLIAESRGRRNVTTTKTRRHGGFHQGDSLCVSLGVFVPLWLRFIAIHRTPSTQRVSARSSTVSSEPVRTTLPPHFGDLPAKDFGALATPTLHTEGKNGA